MGRKMRVDDAGSQGACELAPVRGLLYAAAFSVPLWVAAAAWVIWAF
jgi:hypothetical protein